MNTKKGPGAGPYPEVDARGGGYSRGCSLFQAATPFWGGVQFTKYIFSLWHRPPPRYGPEGAICSFPLEAWKHFMKWYLLYMVFVIHDICYTWYLLYMVFVIHGICYTWYFRIVSLKMQRTIQYPCCSSWIQVFIERADFQKVAQAGACKSGATLWKRGKQRLIPCYQWRAGGGAGGGAWPPGASLGCRA